MSQAAAPRSDGAEPAAPPKVSSLRRFQDRLRGSLGRDSKERDRKQEGDPNGTGRAADGDGDAQTAAADVGQGRLSPRAHPGVARISVPDMPAAGPAHAHPVGQPARQEPEAKGQVVGRMGVGVASRGVGGLDTAQPVTSAVGAADANDYGVHPACITAPSPASPNHKRNSSGHGVVSRTLQAVKSKVARHDGKHRTEVGHVHEAHPASAKRQEEPAMQTAFAAAPEALGDGGSGGRANDVPSAAAHPSHTEATGQTATPRPAEWQAARADAEAEVAEAKRAADGARATAAAATGSTPDTKTAQAAAA